MIIYLIISKKAIDEAKCIVIVKFINSIKNICKKTLVIINKNKKLD
jgi:hypothetical protein